VNVHDAKTHLSRLLDRAAAGEEIVIGRAGKPVARLVALEPATPIQFGGLEGRVDMTHFDDADSDIDRLFFGNAPA
jgi:prevent-host-death family protein